MLCLSSNVPFLQSLSCTVRPTNKVSSISCLTPPQYMDSFYPIPQPLFNIKYITHTPTTTSQLSSSLTRTEPHREPQQRVPYDESRKHQKKAKRRVCHLSRPPVQSPPTLIPIRQLASRKNPTTRLSPDFSSHLRLLLLFFSFPRGLSGCPFPPTHNFLTFRKTNIHHHRSPFLPDSCG
ncbi:hypothetical protein HDV57DRAFT_476713 [Trichoderma longibrachiatum]|uniref:Uncharacterized protein n=1 Tax=Trichoderma longibrachiatum ATCC 18648 TaxID=983965 RepID=A0A2T4C665_TRILO|nr:hypothetical protein M440DRAFT_1242178 [Trichoderma longibrachiatum ATCC 18648]